MDKKWYVTPEMEELNLKMETYLQAQSGGADDVDVDPEEGEGDGPGWWFSIHKNVYTQINKEEAADTQSVRRLFLSCIRCTVGVW